MIYWDDGNFPKKLRHRVKKVALRNLKKLNKRITEIDSMSAGVYRNINWMLINNNLKLFNKDMQHKKKGITELIIYLQS